MYFGGGSLGGGGKGGPVYFGGDALRGGGALGTVEATRETTAPPDAIASGNGIKAPTSLAHTTLHHICPQHTPHKNEHRPCEKQLWGASARQMMGHGHRLRNWQALDSEAPRACMERESKRRRLKT